MTFIIYCLPVYKYAMATPPTIGGLKLISTPQQLTAKKKYIN
ncbi:MAG: hypothetical protein NT127_06630 [Sphingobacteriales bacterium]|nr:hypothetical protein [Sphingobacteriales bacterium]